MWVKVGRCVREGGKVCEGGSEGVLVRMQCVILQRILTAGSA